MAYIKNLDTSELITRYVSVKVLQNVIRSVHTTLDGRQLVQRFGKPTISYSALVFVDDNGRNKLLAAEDNASLLEINSGANTYLGRVIDLSNFEKVSNQYYKATVTVTREENTT